MSRPSIAICFSGQMRSFDQCIDSWRETFFSRHKCDVFVHTTPEGMRPDLLDGLNVINCSVESDVNIDEHDYNERKAEEITVQKTLRMFRSIYECDRLRLLGEKLRGERYDWVVRARFDTVFLKKPTELGGDNTRVYVPRHDGHRGGLCDRFAFGGSCPMQVYAETNLYQHDYMSLNEGLYHPESILGWVLRNRVSWAYTDAVVQTIRPDGTRIPVG